MRSTKNGILNLPVEYGLDRVYSILKKKTTHPFLPIINLSIILNIKYKEVDAGYLNL